MALRADRFIALLLVCCLWVNSGCNSNTEKSISIIWEADKATAVAIPKSYFQNIPSDSVAHVLRVRLARESGQPTLGTCVIQNDVVYFKPVIPLTRGLSYEILVKDRHIGSVTIDEMLVDAPQLTAVYPSLDTLPENLLKMYLSFSSPMQEGVSMNYITLIEDHRDTLKNVFLDLKPELWNSEGKLLTLWLDPGRIKRDLQPNRTLGSPLRKNGKYTLVVSDKWRSVKGKQLISGLTKHFFVGPRDESIPKVDRWKITEPNIATLDPLRVDFSESLDYSLITQTLKILNSDGIAVPGTIHINDHENGFLFTPVNNWGKSKYQIAVEARLEDLAGNNLNCPFDRDLKRLEKTGQEKIFTLPFEAN